MFRTSGDIAETAPRVPEKETVQTAGFPKRVIQLSGSTASRMIRDAVGAGGELWVNGAGTSMHPTIRNADLVLLAPVKRPLCRGDVVLVATGARFILHRIEMIKDDVVRTRGDARITWDPPALRRHVVARAIAVRTNDVLIPLSGTLRFGARAWLRFALRDVRRRLQRLHAS